MPLLFAASMCIIPPGYAADEAAPPADPGWPREHVSENKKLTVYQPQIDDWKD